MHWPLSTGEVFRLLDVSEHRLSGLIRANKIQVPTVCGRRLWQRVHVLEAARLLGRDDAVLLNMLDSTDAAKPNKAGQA